MLAVTVVLTASEKILASTVGLAWYFHMILPAFAVPACQFKRMNRESIVERVKTE